uniref:Uncharacterized protein n=1 Tax=Oryza meridionalis TaxID=40149 RepID=A0A0E0DPP7_9ORYZ
MSPAWKHRGRKQKLSLPDGWKIEKKKYRYRTDKFYREESTGKLCRSIPEVKSFSGHRNDGQREMVQLESAQEKKPVKKMNKFNLKELPESMDDDYL